jgi:hypothetical protein
LTRRRIGRSRLTRLSILRLTRLTVRRLTRTTRLTVRRLPRLTVRRLTGLLPVPGRPVGGLARLAVLRLTELARIWLPVCHGASVGTRRSSAEVCEGPAMPRKPLVAVRRPAASMTR